MMKEVFCLGLVMTLVACTEQSTEISKPKVIEDASPEVQVSKNINNNTTQRGPCPELRQLVEEMASSGWVSDTARIRKKGLYGMLKSENITLFNNSPFYKVSYDESDIDRFMNREFYRDIKIDLDSQLFSEAKSIWVYFYREQDATNLISDGVIEQWEFANEEQAQLALKQIKSIGNHLYFNTMPYFCCKGNKLFVFHTRAMAFSYDQKEYYDKFLQKINFVNSNK